VSESELGLRPPPEPDPAIVAALASVVNQLVRAKSQPEPIPADMAWRFSGHWFCKHQVARRNRPV
jgi:hypothetical protein